MVRSLGQIQDREGREGILGTKKKTDRRTILLFNIYCTAILFFNLTCGGQWAATALQLNLISMGAISSMGNRCKPFEWQIKRGLGYFISLSPWWWFHLPDEWQQVDNIPTVWILLKLKMLGDHWQNGEEGDYHTMLWIHINKPNFLFLVWCGRSYC